MSTEAILALTYLGFLPPHRKFEFDPKLGIDNPALSLTEDLDPLGNALDLCTAPWWPFLLSQ